MWPPPTLFFKYAEMEQVYAVPCRRDYAAPCGNAVSDLKRDKSTPVLVFDDMDEADEEFLTMAMENIETDQLQIKPVSVKPAASASMKPCSI